MIIDDVNPIFGNNELITPSEFKNTFESFSPKSRAEIDKRKTVWVLALPEQDNENFINNWRNVFEDVLDVEPNKIKPIKLSTLNYFIQK